jgi:hypothetical protein
MSFLVCQKCGRPTISSMSRGPSARGASECYVALKNGKAIKGCSYKQGDYLSKKLADEYLIWANNKLKSKGKNML